MAFDSSKTLLLEKNYLYVRASKGFILEGVSEERIWTNIGYYRFLVGNVAESLGNSYITIKYDSTDAEFIAYCSDLFMEEIQNSITVAIESVLDNLDSFKASNHSDIDSFKSANHSDIDSFKTANHSDLSGISGKCDTLHEDINTFRSLNHNDLGRISGKCDTLRDTIISSRNGAFEYYHQRNLTANDSSDVKNFMAHFGSDDRQFNVGCSSVVLLHASSAMVVFTIDCYPDSFSSVLLDNQLYRIEVIEKSDSSVGCVYNDGAGVFNPEFFDGLIGGLRNGTPLEKHINFTFTNQYSYLYLKITRLH